MLPAVVDQIVWMIKEELRRSGGDVRRAADQYVNAIVTNAVLSARGRLDVRQRDASKAFFVVSNDPTGYLNDNRSNSSWSQQARQLSVKYTDSQRQQRSNDDDDDYDDDDDSDISTVNEDQDSEVVRERSRRMKDRDESRRECDRTRDQDSEKHQSSTSKVSDEGGQLRADRNKKDKTRSGDGKQKPELDGRRKLKDRGQQTCATKTEDEGRGGDCGSATRRTTVIRGDESLDDDDNDDVTRCLRRRDDESIESYLVRSILLLGSVANQSNSSAGPTTGKSWVAQAVDEAAESIKLRRSPERATCRTCTGYNDDRRTVYHGGRQNKKPTTNWLRSSVTGRNRFTSTAGSRYSGNRSTYAYSHGGFTRGGSSVSKSSSFNTMQLAEKSRTPRYRDWVSGQLSGGGASMYGYRSNRADRERFAVWSSRCSTSGAGNLNMHSNCADSATSAAGETAKERSDESPRVNTTEVNTNNSRPVQDNNSRDSLQATTPDDSSVSGKTSTAVSDAAKPSIIEPTTGTAKRFDNNNNNNNMCVDNNDTCDNYYYYDNAMFVNRDDCIHEQYSTNNNNVSRELATRKRNSVSRRCHAHGARRRGAQRRNAAALRAISCSAMEVDAFLRQLESERLDPDAELLSRVLDEYRTVLGLRGDGEAFSLEAWPAAWRLARLPAGQWVVREVLKHAEQCLSNFRHVKPSEYCRRRGLSTLGLALLGGVEDSLTSRLTESVSTELEDVVLQRAVSHVVQALVNMTSSHRHQQHQQHVVCPHCVMLNPLYSKGNYSATSNNTKLVHWPLMGGMLHLVQRGGTWAGCGPAQSPPRCTKCNITAHPSTASVPITVLLYDGPLLCGFNMAIKGLNSKGIN